MIIHANGDLVSVKVTKAVNPAKPKIVTTRNTNLLENEFIVYLN